MHLLNFISVVVLAAGYIPLLDSDNAQKYVICVENSEILMKECDLEIPVEALSCHHESCLSTYARFELAWFTKLLKARFTSEIVEMESLDTGPYGKTASSIPVLEEGIKFAEGETKEKLKRWLTNLHTGLKGLAEIEREITQIKNEVVSSEMYGPYNQQSKMFKLLKAIVDQKKKQDQDDEEEAKKAEEHELSRDYHCRVRCTNCSIRPWCSGGESAYAPWLTCSTFKDHLDYEVVVHGRRAADYFPQKEYSGRVLSRGPIDGGFGNPCPYPSSRFYYDVTALGCSASCH